MGFKIGVRIMSGLSLLSFNTSDIVTFCKWLVSYVYIEISRRMMSKRFDVYDTEAIHEPFKLGFLPPQIEYDLESPQKEEHLLSNADEVFFYGVNCDSECLIVRICRSINEQVEAWIYLRLKDGKIYRLRETAGYETSSTETGREFSLAGLRIHYMKPMRRWRIFFNGVLKETSEVDDTSERMVYVKFAFIWRATSDCFDLTSDVDSAALAKGFARSKWKALTPPFNKFNKAFNFYAQSGNIVGTLQVHEGTDDRILNLFGERMRFLGSKPLENGAVFTHILGQVTKDGSVFHVAEATVPGVVNRFVFGFIVFPSGVLEPISDADILFEKDPAEGERAMKTLFHADGVELKVKADIGTKINCDSKQNLDVHFHHLKIKLNDLEGRGLLMKGEVMRKSNEKAVKIKKKIQIPIEIPMAVHFSEDICEIADVTGGKGSSLGKLTNLSKETQNFIVPNGIVVTTKAYELFLNKEMEEKMKCLEDVLYGKTAGDIKEVCKRVMDEITKTILPEKVLDSVTKCLHKAFGDKLFSQTFAVRSSATDEDTEQMSAAGQMETFLGISGLDEIILAVKKCWASQFDFIAVQYKRQNGQVVNSPMAVVIQEMVPCDVAGVLFTCDPLTGNPTLMTITANYGLGESVVSGSEEPDIITLARNADDKLEVKSKVIGAKNRRHVIKAEEGTTVEEVSEHDKKSCCLTDTLSLRLGDVAVQIEKSYLSKRDIEWGFWNNNLYIFQSRPITSGAGETDFEVDHEADAPMRIENEYFSVCNVGEVMPGAMSTLGLDIMFKYFYIAMMRKSILEWQDSVKPRYYPKGICCMYNHVMFYLLDLLARANEGKKVHEATMVGMFGRVVEDEELFETAMLRHAKTEKRSSVLTYYRLYKCLTSAESRLQKGLKKYVDYHLPVENLNNSQEIFDILVNACDDLEDAMMSHMVATQGSTVWTILVISIIKKDEGVISSDTYSVFSKLLTSIKDVESADVPSALQSLAYRIGKDMNPEDFKKLDCQEILDWLNTTETDAGIKFREFLTKHGHRCLKEFDLRSTTWGTDPTLLIKLLKNIVGNVQDSTSKKAEDFDEILGGMQLKFTKRLMLKFLLPRCRKAVQIREATKSLLIKSQDKWRKAYWHLARVMVSEGRIPDADLMFFMNLEEVREMITNRSPRIISRAKHRHRRHIELDKYIFPEIMDGFPHPVNLYDAPPTPTEDDFLMKGIPVSQGVAKGFVRIALTLEEASQLKPGEVLLTYSTDIGWTPYFPTLAGVVTELGGLVSHGAVVSREYGLPCIAGLHGATRRFRTGDFVLLDGNKGILQKIRPPEP